MELTNKNEHINKNEPQGQEQRKAEGKAGKIVYTKYHKGYLILVVKKGSQFVSMSLNDGQIFRLYNSLKRYIKYRYKKKSFRSKKTYKRSR